MTSAIRWSRGSQTLQASVSAWWCEAKGGEVLRDNPRRRLVRLCGPEGDWLVKHFRLGSGRHRRRERVKGWLGRSPARREARHLARLWKLGVPVPQPLGLGRVQMGPGRGDVLLVLPFLAGEPLGALLDMQDARRRRSLEALGHALRQLHQAGFVHGDLHTGNVLVTPAGPILLDLQRARRSRHPAAHIRDLGALDFALWDRAPLSDRLRLRMAALGVTHPLDPAARRRMRAVGEAACKRAWQHGRSRTRRALRPGRLYAPLTVASGTGLRWREFPAAAVEAALEAHRATLEGAGDDTRIWKHDERSRVTAVEALGFPVVVKQVLPRSLPRKLADMLRGSAARRAWRGGHGLAMRGIGAARPLAFLEQRRFLLPQVSWLILAQLRGRQDAVALGPRDPEPVLEALLRLTRQLHQRGVVHGDLKGNHILLDPLGRQAPCLVDLEGVRFRRRLSDTQRLESLAQLNASLPDTIPAALRLTCFQRYLVRHPFACGGARALQEVVARSLERRHRWSGVDCACACSQGVRVRTSSR